MAGRPASSQFAMKSLLAESPALAARRVKEIGRECGFDLVRITTAAQLASERDRYIDWVGAGRQAEMQWITVERAERSADPRAVVPDARSVICLAMSYATESRGELAEGHGRIARYAWGRDYHQALGERLSDMVERLQQQFGGAHRWYVDTGPLMDKALAARAGIGWYGKNTNILAEDFGSFVLLGEIVTNLALEPDTPLRRNCGSCRLCVVACPTGALGPDYSIDAGKCISYLTIEHRGPIPLGLRPHIGDWVFGCDICQDVCPPTMAPLLPDPEARREWLSQVRRTLSGSTAPSVRRSSTPRISPDHPLFSGGTRESVNLVWLLQLSHDEYLNAFRGTTVRRAKVWMLRRNAAVALGNVGGTDAVPALLQSLVQDDHPLVRGHAAWALGRLAFRLGRTDLYRLLRERLASESDPAVRAEIEVAVTGWDAGDPAPP